MHFVETKGILSAKNGMNLYRGCTHGCIYCDSRSRCYHMDHDFTDIEVKQNAIELLEDALRRKRRPCMLSTGSMTDPYIPPEQQLQHLRQALELAYRYGCGFTLITKSDLVLRDIDLLQKINRQTKCVVQMTLTTYDDVLCQKLEPRVSVTSRRFAALQALRAAGIPTVVWLCPILPFINDDHQNIAGILDYCVQAKVRGIICFGMGLTLREGSREYFYAQLDKLFPHLKKRYIQTYGGQYSIVSPRNKELMQFFHQQCAAHGIMHDNRQIFTYLHTLDQERDQLRLF